MAWEYCRCPFPGVGDRMVNYPRFECCGSNICKAGMKSIMFFDFELSDVKFNTVLFTTFGKGRAYTVTIDQSNEKDFVDKDTTVINQGATDHTYTYVKITLRYMRVIVNMAGAGSFKICRLLLECCTEDLELIADILGQLDVALSTRASEATLLLTNTALALIDTHIGDVSTLISKNDNIVYAAGDANAVKTVSLAMTSPGLIAKIAVMRTATGGTAHTGMTVRVYENSVAQQYLLYENTGIVVAAGITTVLNTVPLAYIPHTDTTLIVQLTPTGGDGTTTATYNCKIITQKMRV